MKNKLLLLLLLLSPLVINSQEKLDIDITKSSIKWIGELTFSFGGHDGYINFKEGYFIKTGDVITGGEFIIDMNSITNTDIKKQEANKSLVDHLKNPDFFDAKKFPTAKLKITAVKYFKNNGARFYGNLTIKGITKPIQFYSTLDYPNKTMKTRFKIDRQEWNINYQSKFKNSFISDAIGFEVTIKL